MRYALCAPIIIIILIATIIVIHRPNQQHHHHHHHRHLRTAGVHSCSHIVSRFLGAGG